MQEFEKYIGVVAERATVFERWVFGIFEDLPDGHTISKTNGKINITDRDGKCKTYVHLRRLDDVRGRWFADVLHTDDWFENYSDVFEEASLRILSS